MEYLPKEVREELELARLVVPMLMVLKLGISNPDQLRWAKSRRSPLIENLNTKN